MPKRASSAAPDDGLAEWLRRVASHGTLQGPMPEHRDERAEWLNHAAKAYPWTTFNINELALMLRVDRHVITAVAGYTGPRAPFKGKSKRARPKAVFDFLHDPPADFFEGT